ncbi:sensor histidine kinase [Solicola gregarius]|uniref:histidine kinase n=1 Tax=Solicola gregarius TaxID=2908642 RepID=A0AA46TGP0_9ACTN|nr:histidine kinase [Solicola gregarius]UYM04457.1 histidine kinase [Solicola gregarius]
MTSAGPEYQPRLRWWSHLWRIALVVLISALAWSVYAKPEWDENRALFWTDLLLGIASLGLMQLRRRWPLTIALVLNAFMVVSGASAGASCLATVSVATQRRWGQIISVSIVGLVASASFTALAPTQVGGPEPAWVSFTTNVVFTIALVAIGMYVGSRRELLWTLRERATRAEQEQELRVAQARTNERARIAREMHDVLAHRISLVTMHAGALSYRTDLGREEIARSAEVIQTNAHEALTELRGVLGVLRGQDAEDAKNRPQPTIGDVPELVADALDYGMNLDFENGLDERTSVPDATGRTVYRIVQEGLTNARKHAPDAKVTLSVSRDDTGIRVDIRNPLRVGRDGTTPGAGLGLIGLTERAELTGGSLRHRINGHGEFEVRAWLPCPP